MFFFCSCPPSLPPPKTATGGSSLSDWLADAAQRPDFTTADVDDQIIAACEALGLDPAGLYDFGGDDDPDGLVPEGGVHEDVDPPMLAGTDPPASADTG